MSRRAVLEVVAALCVGVALAAVVTMGKDRDNVLNRGRGNPGKCLLLTEEPVECQYFRDRGLVVITDRRVQLRRGEVAPTVLTSPMGDSAGKN